MSENDIIAEYVKEKYPEILETVDFAVYKLHNALRNLANDFLDSFKKIDFKELKELASKLNNGEKGENDG